HDAVIASGARVSGATVHLVDEVYDRGRILAQWPVPVLAGDTPETLAARVLRVEHVLLPAVVESLAAGSERIREDPDSESEATFGLRRDPYPDVDVIRTFVTGEPPRNPTVPDERRD